MLVVAHQRRARKYRRFATPRDGRESQCASWAFLVHKRTGVVYHEVLAEAEAWGADLIIVGSHSPSMGTYLVGSNAQKIVRRANCSVRNGFFAPFAYQG
ncbi:MAG TPA: universal stress protein [Methylocella sp.]